jgi:hypothetical protein
MAICHERRATNLPIRDLSSTFDREFDRRSVCDAAGWSADDLSHLDVYSNMPDVYSFPTADELIATVPSSFAAPRLISSGVYELAERCPILVAELK